MFKLLQRFVREEDGQDFAEYALILGTVGVVAIAVIARYRNELLPSRLASKPCAWREAGKCFAGKKKDRRWRSSP